MNILVICAHPDDEMLGCGGTIRKLANDGHQIFTHVLCGSADARHNRPPDDIFFKTIAAAEGRIGIKSSIKNHFENIQFNVIPHLQIVQAIEHSIVEFTPEWIFTHHYSDLNIDHRVCYEATVAAVRLPERRSRPELSPTMIKKVLLFEIPSSTDWRPPDYRPFRPTCFIEITSTLEEKVAALSEFEGALKEWPHPRSREGIITLARMRGSQIGVEAAEAFEVIREILTEA